MQTRTRCFACGRFAKPSAVVLLENAVSGTRIFVHRERCCESLMRLDEWREVDATLGESGPTKSLVE